MMPFVESNYASEGMDVQKEPSCQSSCPRRDGEKINKYVVNHCITCKCVMSNIGHKKMMPTLKKYFELVWDPIQNPENLQTNLFIIKIPNISGFPDPHCIHIHQQMILK